MSDRPRAAVLAGSVLFLALALPSDVADIIKGLTHPDSSATWQLSLGLSLKTLMTLAAISGLALDRTFGYAGLLGASLQITLIRVGDFLGVWPAGGLAAVATYWRQLVVTTMDLAFRAGCFVFLAVRWRRLVGER